MAERIEDDELRAKVLAAEQAILPFDKLYVRSIETKIVARENILTTYHPNHWRHTKAQEELVMLRVMLKKLEAQEVAEKKKPPEKKKEPEKEEPLPPMPSE